MERSMNPSSMRSRRWITKALLELMMIKPYKKISITEIASEADVVRRTFYRNFESKEDVIKTYIESIFKSFQKKLIEEDESYDTAMIGHHFFSHMNRHKVFLQLLADHDMFDLILEVFEERLYKDFSEDESIERLMKYQRGFHIAGLWYMLRTWITSGMKETAEELADIYKDIYDMQNGNS
jgi:AcrR family transcriptional regulator